MAIGTRTKAVRIFASDDHSLNLVAGLLNRSRADVFHAAWTEFLNAHRQELAQVFQETQEALASGDIDRLSEASASALEAQIDRLAANLPS